MSSVGRTARAATSVPPRGPLPLPLPFDPIASVGPERGGANVAETGVGEGTGTGASSPQMPDWPPVAVAPVALTRPAVARPAAPRLVVAWASRAAVAAARVEAV